MQRPEKQTEESRSIATPEAGTAKVTGPGQDSRIARRRPGGRDTTNPLAVCGESASSRKGPRRCLNRHRRTAAAGLSGIAATPGSVPVWCATRPPRRNKRAARSRRSLSRTGSFCRMAHLFRYNVRFDPQEGFNPRRESPRPAWHDRPVASRSAAHHHEPVSARPAGRHSLRR